MSGSTRKDVQLNINATLNGQQNITTMRELIGQLNGSIETFQKAMGQGTLSSRELTGALDQLGRTGAGLNTALKNINSFESTGRQIEEVTARIGKLTAARDKLASAGVNTDKQQAALDKANKAVDTAEKRLAALQSRSVLAGAALERLGLDAASGTEAMVAEVAVLAEQAAKTRNSIQGLSDSYARVARERKEAAEQSAEEARQEAAALKEVADFVAASDAEQSARNKRRVELAAAARQQQVADAKAAQQEEASLAAFREQAAANLARNQQQARAEAIKNALDEQEAAQKAAEAQQRFIEVGAASQGRLRNLTTTASPAAPAFTSNRASVNATIDPNAAARSTLPGNTAQVSNILSGVDQGSNTTERYLADLKNVTAAQQELARQAGLVDSFKTQQAAVAALSAEFEQAKEAALTLSSAMQTPGAGTEELAGKLKVAEANANQLAASLGKEETTLAALAQRLEQAKISTTDFAAVEKQLQATAAETVQAVDKLNNKLKETGGKKGDVGFLGLRPYELKDLSYQVNDVVTSLASGISLEQTAAQQGGQIFQIFQGELVGLGSLLIPISVGLVALGLAFVALNRDASNTQALRTYQGLLAASADGTDYTATALVGLQKSLQATGVSFADAGTMIKAFVAAGINETAFVKVGEAVKNLSEVTGDDLKTSLQDVTGLFGGSMQAIDDLDKKYDFLTEAQRNQIQALFDQGNATAAVNEAFNLFAQKQDEGAQKARGPWKDAMISLKEGFSELLDIIARLIHPIGELFAVIANGFRFTMDSITSAVHASSDQAKAQIPALQAQLAQLQAEKEKNSKVGTNGPAGGYGDVAAQNRNEALDTQIATAQSKLAQLQSLAGTTDTVKGDTAAVNENSQARLKRGDAMLRELKIQLDQKKLDNEDLKDLTPAQRATHLSDVSTAAGQRAGEKFDQGGGGSAAQRAQYVAAAQADAVDDVNKKYKQYDEEKAKRDEAAAKKAADAAREEANTRESLINEIEAASAAADAKDKTNLDARLRNIQEGYAKTYAKIDEYQRKYGNSLGNGQTTDGLRSQLQAAEAVAEQQEKLKYYEDATNVVVNQRTDLYKEVNEEVASGAITAQQGYDRISASTDGLNKQLTSAVDKALAFAKALQDAGKGSPQLDAFIAKMNLVKASAGTGAGSAKGKEDSTLVTSGMTDINDLVKQRTDLVAAEQGLVKLGLESDTTAQQKIANAYNTTTPLIQNQINMLESLLATQLKNGEITETQYDTQIAKLKQIQEGTKHVNEDAQKVTEVAQQAFAQGMVTAIDSATSSLAKFALGQEDAKGLFKDLLAAAGNFFATFIEDIANAILQLEAMKIAEELIGTTSSSSSGSSSSGGLSSLLGNLFGSSTSSSSSSGGGFLSSLFGSGGDALASSDAFADLAGDAAFFHSGGIVGGNVTMTRTGIDPTIFATAPRYHDGLEPDEQAAVLQNGERVVTVAQQKKEADQKMALTAAASSGGKQPIRQVLAIGEDQINQAMAGRSGEQTVITHIKNNRTTIKQLLGT